MHLKTIEYYIKQIKFVSSKFSKCKKMLEKGKYKLLSSLRVVLLNETWVEELGTKYFGGMEGGKTSARVANIVNKFGILKNNKSKHNLYQAMYIANNDNKDREVKLFSFNKKKIMTICVSKEDYDKQFEIYNSLSKNHNMPRIIPIEEYPNSYEISMIQIEERPTASEVLYEISKSTILQGYNNQKVSIKEIVNADYDSTDLNAILKKLSAYINPEVLKLSIPLSTQHGDLSMDNLLYGEAEGRKGFWWIDWEHVGDRIFCYDYFFYILNSAKWSNNLETLQSYFSGEADDGLKDMFNSFGLAYEEKYRLDYFLMAVICILKERVCKLGYVETLKEYYEFIQVNVLNKFQDKD